MISGMLNPDKIDMKISQICPPHLSDVATLPWEIQKKSFSAVLFVHTFDYLRYLKRKLTNPLDNPTWKCHHASEMQNFIIWLKVCCVLSNVGRCEESQLWVVIGGSEKNQLWCVAIRMSGKQCHSKCSEWPHSALIHASNLFQHWSVA